MPLFDVGAERSPLVLLTRPEQSAFDADAHAVVHEHLPTLLGAKAFTIGGGAGDRRAGTRDLSPGCTLALDATGAAVVVVVTASFGESELTAALGEAGRASRLTRTELAELYPAGPERFHKDVTDFYDALPAGRWPHPGRGTVRLVVVCADVAPDVHDALAFLRSAGSTVEVLQLGTVPSTPGRRLVDVSTFPPATSASSADGSAPRGVVGRMSTGAVAAVPVGRVSAPVPRDEPAPGQRGGPVRTSAFGAPSLPPVPVAASAGDMTTILPPVRATDYPVYSLPPLEPLEPFEQREPATRRQGRSPLSAPLPVVDLPAPGTPYTPIFLSVPDMLANLPARPSDVPAPDLGPRASLDLAVAPADATGYVAGPGESAAWEGSGSGLTGRSAYRASAFIAAKKYMPEKLDRTPPPPEPVRERQPAIVHASRSGSVAPGRAPREPAPFEPAPFAPDPVQTGSALPVAFDGPASLSFDEPGSPFWADLSAQFAEPVRFDPPDAVRTGPTDAALVALAAELHEALPLVWVRHRRGERFEALLHPDGTLEASDGLRFGDPSVAANAVSGSTAADGWRVWRAGESGPTLAELRG